MDIEQLRTEWQLYDQRLTLSHRMNEQLILSMLKERSRSRVSKIRQQNLIYMALMFVTLILIAAIFAGNPFDFKYTLQYIPYAILFTGVILAILSLFKSLQSLDVNLNHVSLEFFLKKIIQEYEKNKKMEGWFGVIMFCGAVLTTFSFLPKKLENKELWPALGETALSMLITLTIYFIAYKLGAFKNRKKEGFENDLKELNDLKTIASELRETN